MHNKSRNISELRRALYVPGESYFTFSMNPFSNFVFYQSIFSYFCCYGKKLKNELLEQWTKDTNGVSIFHENRISWPSSRIRTSIFPILRKKVNLFSTWLVIHVIFNHFRSDASWPENVSDWFNYLNRNLKCEDIVYKKVDWRFFS